MWARDAQTLERFARRRATESAHVLDHCAPHGEKGMARRSTGRRTCDGMGMEGRRVEKIFLLVAGVVSTREPCLVILGCSRTQPTRADWPVPRLRPPAFRSFTFWNSRSFTATGASPTPPLPSRPEFNHHVDQDQERKAERRQDRWSQRHRGRRRPRIHYPPTQESTFSLMKSKHGLASGNTARHRTED